MFRFAATIMWVFGIVLAQGFWSTLFAIFMPLWAWYLAVSYLFTRFLGT